VPRKKREGKAEKAARFKRAFDEIIGDPYAQPDALEGQYSTLKNRSSVSIGEPDRKSKSPVNEARPSAVDFFIDVDSAVADGLEVWGHFHIVAAKDMFYDTYFYEAGVILTQKERSEVEQVIGGILVDRGISPASKYFTAIRQ
jgi:hypothetical protein